MTHGRFSICSALTIAALACAASGASGGQATPPPEGTPEQATFTLAPVLSITDFGVDTNILATPQDQHRDMVGRFAVGVEPTSHLGRVDLRGHANLSYAYFRQYSDQRSVDTDDLGRIAVRVNRVTLFGSGALRRTGDAYGPEIDVRTLRTENTILGGADVQLGERTLLTVAGSQTHLKFDSSEVLFDASVREQMNRAVDNVVTEFRDDITPLTTVSVVGDVERDRFEFTPIRDTTSARVLAGFEFKPTAVLDGKAYVGYRVFHPLDPGELNLGSIVSAVDVGYTLAEATRFGVIVQRDLGYSYSLFERYYIVTDVRATVTRRLTPDWDITGMVGRQNLAYREEGMPVAVDQPATNTAPPVDHLFRFGVGVLARVGRTFTFGVNLESYSRDSTLSGNYDRTRLLSSMGVHF